MYIIILIYNISEAVFLWDHLINSHHSSVSSTISVACSGAISCISLFFIFELLES